MSRARLFDRHAEAEEARLHDDYASGRITRAELNEGLRDLQREEREARQQDRDEASENVDREWGY